MRAKREPSHIEDWLPEIGSRKGPIYHAIASAIAEAIRDGDLMAGDRLAPHRTIARLLGIDLTTATRAYAEARRRGLVESRVGQGTFVRAEAPLLQARRRHGPIVDLTMNLPPVPDRPDLQSLLREGLDRVFRRDDLAALMTYHWDTGTADDRQAASVWLRPCLDPLELDRVLVCPGAQTGLLAVISTVARAGDVVLAESVTYPGIRALAAQFGIRLAGVPIDDEGLQPDALDRLCHELRPRLIYCNPTIQNPTTATMSIRRRRDVVEIARAHAIPILEDDAYGLLPQVPMPALASFAPELVFYLATTAKALTPGLRVAYLVSPSKPLTERLASAMRSSVRMGSGLLTGLVTSMIRSGDAAHLLAAIRAEAQARQAVASQVLDGCDVVAHPDGLHVWLRLPPDQRAGDLSAYVRHQGLAIVSDDTFRVERSEVNAVRIALGAAANRQQLEIALAAVAAAVPRHDPAVSKPIV